MKQINKKNHHGWISKTLIAAAILYCIGFVLYGAFHRDNVWVINGRKSVVYEHSADSLFIKGAKEASEEDYRLTVENAKEYSRLVLVKPTLENIIDFYGVCQEAGSKLIVSTDAETASILKSQLHDLSFSVEQVKFDSTTDYDPNLYENFEKNYSY